MCNIWQKTVNIRDVPPILLYPIISYYILLYPGNETYSIFIWFNILLYSTKCFSVVFLSYLNDFANLFFVAWLFNHVFHQVIATLRSLLLIVCLQSFNRLAETFFGCLVKGILIVFVTTPFPAKVYEKIKTAVIKHINTNTLYQYRRHYVRENKNNICPTLTANMGGGGHNVPLLKDDKGIRKLTPRECFNLQGFPNGYILPDIADSLLYKMAGNAITVTIANLIMRRIESLL